MTDTSPLAYGDLKARFVESCLEKVSGIDQNQNEVMAMRSVNYAWHYAVAQANQYRSDWLIRRNWNTYCPDGSLVDTRREEEIPADLAAADRLRIFADEQRRRAYGYAHAPRPVPRPEEQTEVNYLNEDVDDEQTEDEDWAAMGPAALRGGPAAGGEATRGRATGSGQQRPPRSDAGSGAQRKRRAEEPQPDEQAPRVSPENDAIYNGAKRQKTPPRESREASPAAPAAEPEKALGESNEAVDSDVAGEASATKRPSSRQSARSDGDWEDLEGTSTGSAAATPGRYEDEADDGLNLNADAQDQDLPPSADELSDSSASTTGSSTPSSHGSSGSNALRAAIHEIVVDDDFLEGAPPQKILEARRSLQRLAEEIREQNEDFDDEGSEKHKSFRSYGWLKDLEVADILPSEAPSSQDLQAFKHVVDVIRTPPKPAFSGRTSVHRKKGERTKCSALTFRLSYLGKMCPEHFMASGLLRTNSAFRKCSLHALSEMRFPLWLWKIVSTVNTSSFDFVRPRWEYFYGSEQNPDDQIFGKSSSGLRGRLLASENAISPPWIWRPQEAMNDLALKFEVFELLCDQ